MAEREFWPEMFPLPFSGADADSTGASNTQDQDDPRLDRILEKLEELTQRDRGDQGAEGNRDLAQIRQSLDSLVELNIQMLDALENLGDA